MLKSIFSTLFVLIIISGCSAYQLKIPYMVGRAENDVNVLIIPFEDQTGYYEDIGCSIEEKIAEGITSEFKGIDLSLRSEAPRYKKVPCPYNVKIANPHRTRQSYDSHVIIKGNIEQIEYTNNIQDNVYYGNPLLDIMSMLDSERVADRYCGIIGLRYEVINAMYDSKLKGGFVVGTSGLVNPQKTDRNTALKRATKDIIEQIVSHFTERK